MENYYLLAFIRNDYDGHKAGNFETWKLISFKLKPYFYIHNSSCDKSAAFLEAWRKIDHSNVVNDIALRVVQLPQDWKVLIMVREELKQFLLRCVQEYREKNLCIRIEKIEGQQNLHYSLKCFRWHFININMWEIMLRIFSTY